jgi:integrase
MLEDVLKIARLPVHSITDKRAQAAICFLYLSGMRITAFLTLPLACVNIDGRQIEQNPGKGVITKNRKAAITTLLSIPELLEIVKDWDDQIRRELPLDSPWFAYIDHFDQLMPPGKNFQERVNGRRMACIKGMKRLCARANVPYKFPHMLRYAHAIFGIKHARHMQELKAVSQNLMRSSISITDGI